MDPRSWGEQFFTYGPYAILALFVLWVTPNQLKIFRQIDRKNFAQLFLGGFIAAACCAVVFAMVLYIYLFWPPRSVYLGSFGSQPSEARFISQTPQLYVSSKPAGGNRLHWDYAIVSDVYQETGNTFSFTYQWGPDDRDYKDYSLPLTLVKKQRVDLSTDPGHPGTLYYKDDSDSASPLRPLETLARASVGTHRSTKFTFVTAAQAQAQPNRNKNALIDWLGSPNANLRAQARAQLRLLSREELRRLLQEPGLSAIARYQMTDELGHRR